MGKAVKKIEIRPYCVTKISEIRMSQILSKRFNVTNAADLNALVSEEELVNTAFYRHLQKVLYDAKYRTQYYGHSASVDDIFFLIIHDKDIIITDDERKEYKLSLQSSPNAQQRTKYLRTLNYPFFHVPVEVFTTDDIPTPSAEGNLSPILAFTQRFKKAVEVFMADKGLTWAEPKVNSGAEGNPGLPDQQGAEANKRKMDNNMGPEPKVDSDVEVNPEFLDAKQQKVE